MSADRPPTHVMSGLPPIQLWDAGAAPPRRPDRVPTPLQGVYEEHMARMHPRQAANPDSENDDMPEDARQEQEDDGDNDDESGPDEDEDDDDYDDYDDNDHEPGPSEHQHEGSGDENDDDVMDEDEGGNDLPVINEDDYFNLYTGDYDSENTSPVVSERLLSLLRNLLNTGNLITTYEDPHDVMQYLHAAHNRPREPRDPGRFPKVPSREGRLLMESGVFGALDYSSYGPKNMTRRLIDRELGIGGLGERCRNSRIIRQGLIPSSKAESIIHYDDAVYGGQFSDDGSFFYTFSQDFKVRLYDTSNPWNWRHYKTVHYPWASWTLTDASLSPDNKFLAYTSLTSQVCLTPTNPKDRGDPYFLDLGDPMYQGRCGIFSVRFSGDGRELVAGTNANSIIIYDIESRTPLHHVKGHDNDVNAVCFADKGSPHIIYSGSDDCTVKIWDRRSMRHNREAGVFVGHREGITYIDSKGDGRYVLSNGKDQTMKLWDLRKAMGTEYYHASVKRIRSRYNCFDYRAGTYDEDLWDPHPHDNSTVTFRGHKVLRTLIRCHFSPPGSTDSRFVYSGSQDGGVYIWNMDATLAAVIDVKGATKDQRPTQPANYSHWSMRGDPTRWSTLVRDASWHPAAPVLVASSWNGPGLSCGTCSIHSYNEGGEDEEGQGEAQTNMGKNVTDKIQPFTESAAE